MRPYLPGSFTKNYGWNEPPASGLAKLHDAIRAGFRLQLKPVERDTFRQRHPDLDEQRQLVPVNFFLGNVTEGGVHYVAVDELVLVALREAHSPRFDLLALFALHLARVGNRDGRTGHGHAARYLGDFVREHVWDGQGWRRERISNSEIEKYLSRAISTKEDADTLHKCTTNYGYILGQTVRRGRGDYMELQTDEWIESALKLAFDRVSIEHAPLLPPTRSQLLAVLGAEELHKLVGWDAPKLMKVAEGVVDGYLAEGGLRRFN